MRRFCKPKYKAYARLNDDILNEFRITKFNNFKWNRLKKKIRFDSIWLFFKYRKRIFRKRSKGYSRRFFARYIKIFDHFYYSRTKDYVGLRRNATSPKDDASVLAVENQTNYKNTFKSRLFSKQKLCYYYNIQDYKLKKLIRRAYAKFMRTDAFICFLEKRLDNVLYKAGFVLSFRQGRQLILHRKVLVNGVIQSKTEYSVKTGDLVELCLPAFLLLKPLHHPSRYLFARKLKRKKKYLKLVRVKPLGKYSCFKLHSVHRTRFVRQRTRVINKRSSSRKRYRQNTRKLIV